MTSILWLCGPSGVGKSSTAFEIFSRLEGAAYVDIDQVGLCYPPPADDPQNDRVKARNLGSVWRNFVAAGARAVIISGITRNVILYTAQLPRESLTICRLRADELRDRFLGRGWRPELVEDAVAEAELLDRTEFADFCLDTTGLSVAEAARLVLDRWP
jgi:broad-specificity NMP kinase